MRVLLWCCLAAVVAQAQPDAADAHLRRAAAYREKRDYSHAIPELRRALELRPGLTQAHGMLGEALLAQGFAAEALPHLERAGMLYLHAVALVETNRLPEAIGELLQVQARRPNDPDVLFYLGKASGALMQQTFQRLVRLHPDSARSYELQAQNFLGQRRGDLAEPLFREALKRQPDLPGIHKALGSILMERGDLDGAEKELRAEAELTPGDAETAWRLGSALLKKGQSKDALGELRRSDRLKPEMLETLFDLGRAYLAENQVEQAQATFAHMLRIDDTGDLAAVAHLQLSQIARKLGRTEEAAEHLRRYRELSPKPGANPQ